MRYRVAVAAHKPYRMPSDPLYTPMHAGAWQDPSPWYTADGRLFTRDDEGEHISPKNSSYCELTVQYALRHGPEAEIYGLCHYRRYFAGKRHGNPWMRILTKTQADTLMDGIDVLLPKKRHYLIQSGWDQYAHAHHAQDLIVTRQVLSDICDPAYVQAFDQVFARRSGHRFNMFLMRQVPFFAYSDWLFAVLTQVEARLDTSGYTLKDMRVFGYLGERLLDVWLQVNPQRIRECPIVNLESQHWLRKGLLFLWRAIRPAR